MRCLAEAKTLSRERQSILNLGRYAPCISALTIGQPVHRPGGDEVSAQSYMVVGVKFALIENLERPFD